MMDIISEYIIMSTFKLDSNKKLFVNLKHLWLATSNSLKFVWIFSLCHLQFRIKKLYFLVFFIIFKKPVAQNSSQF